MVLDGRCGVIRPEIDAVLANLRALALELDWAGLAIAAHQIRKAATTLAAELERLDNPTPVHVHVDTPLVRPHVAPQEDDGDPEVFGW